MPILLLWICCIQKMIVPLSLCVLHPNYCWLFSSLLFDFIFVCLDFLLLCINPLPIIVWHSPTYLVSIPASPAPVDCHVVPGDAHHPSFCDIIVFDVIKEGGHWSTLFDLPARRAVLLKQEAAPPRGKLGALFKYDGRWITAPHFHHIRRSAPRDLVHSRRQCRTTAVPHLCNCFSLLQLEEADDDSRGLHFRNICSFIDALEELRKAWLEEGRWLNNSLSSWQPWRARRRRPWNNSSSFSQHLGHLRKASDEQQSLEEDGHETTAPHFRNIWGICWGRRATNSSPPGCLMLYVVMVCVICERAMLASAPRRRVWGGGYSIF